MESGWPIFFYGTMWGAVGSALVGLVGLLLALGAPRNLVRRISLRIARHSGPMGAAGLYVTLMLLRQLPIVVLSIFALLSIELNRYPSVDLWSAASFVVPVGILIAGIVWSILLLLRSCPARDKGSARQVFGALAFAVGWNIVAPAFGILWQILFGYSKAGDGLGMVPHGFFRSYTCIPQVVIGIWLIFAAWPIGGLVAGLAKPDAIGGARSVPPVREREIGGHGDRGTP